MIKRLSRYWTLILIILLIATGVVLAARRLSARTAHAQVSATAAFVCTPFDVGVFIQRVHVRCTVAANVGGNLVSWWAYPTSDSAGASRFLSLFETAKATGTNITIYYDPADLTGSTFGCGNSDCRRIWGATSP